MSTVNVKDQMITGLQADHDVEFDIPNSHSVNDIELKGRDIYYQGVKLCTAESEEYAQMITAILRDDDCVLQYRFQVPRDEFGNIIEEVTNIIDENPPSDM